MIVFFDASALIYLVEGAEPFAGCVRSTLVELTKEHPKLDAAVSRLSWLECRVRPARNNELATLARFDAFFARPDLVWVELGKNVVELARAIRVRCGLPTPDAIQAASCLQLGAVHLFLTGDITFKKVSELNTRMLT